MLLSEAYDAQDPNGNITIKWDVIRPIRDGYMVRYMYVHLYLYIVIHPHVNLSPNFYIDTISNYKINYIDGICGKREITGLGLTIFQGRI